MKKIKILLTGMSNNLGGIETYIYNLYKNADKNKFEFSFLAFDYGKKICYEDELIADGIKIYKITPRTKNYIKFLKDLKEVYQQNNFDYIHFNLMDFSCYERIIYANRYSNAKIIVHSHCGNVNYLKSKSIVSKMFNHIGMKKINKIPSLKVACGKQAGEFMFPNHKFTIFNNGVNIDKFKFNKINRAEIRKELKIKEDETIIGLVAAFFPVKNHSFLIDVFKELNIKKSKLILIGEGPLKEEINKKVQDYNMKDKVLFLGKRLDIDKVYSALDIYLMPSLGEGLSISLVEAQVNGLKCYTSDTVDKNSNITGNVEFLSLEKSPKEWADYIISRNNQRDEKVLNKIPDEFNAKKSYAKVYQFYEKNLK